MGIGANHSINGFINSAVAAEHKDQIRAIAHRSGRKVSGVSGFLGGNEARVNTRATEGVGGTL